MSREEIDKICKENSIRNYTVQDDGTVDVDGLVSIMFDRRMSKLPIRFGTVTGNFHCNNNGLTTLEGAPHTVGRGFECQNNFLTNLEHSPQIVGSWFQCQQNDLTSLVGCPEKVEDFNCSNNNLIDLKGSPIEVSGTYRCSNNGLTSFKGLSKSVGAVVFHDNKITNLDSFDSDLIDGLFLWDNPIESIVGDVAVKSDFIKAFVVYKVVKDGQVNLKRLKYVMEMFDMKVNLDKISKRYKIV
jgi:hypothetical protein